jgi:hypothetical protein
MPEEKSTKLGGWIKAGLASIASLVSGAVLMYASPLVNSAIKPSKPVANFAFNNQGLTVTFDNRSAGGSEGWWDFGDGSALEPFVPGQDNLQHTYANAGVYSVKLTLRNFLGEENERIVSVPVDTTTAVTPVIEEFKVVRLNSDNSAPAVFRLLAKVKNAQLALWSLGDDRPLEINTDPAQSLDRLATIKEAGYYTLRLVAVNGKQTVERAEQVWVAMPHEGAPGATLQVTYDAVQVIRKEKKPNIQVTFPAEVKGNTFNFAQAVVADPGYQILKAELAKPNKDNSVRNLRLDINPDKTVVRVTGELIKSNSPKWSTQIKLTQEMRSQPVRQNMEPIPVALQVPGVTVVPIPHLPLNFEARQKNLNLEVRDGNRVIWHGTQLPINQVVQFKNRPCRFTATEQGDQIRLDVVEVKQGLFPAGN